MSTSPRRLRACLPLLAVLALGLGACGSQTSDSAAPSGSGSASNKAASPSGSPSASAPAGTPDCSAVWKNGTKIPRAYRGCADGNGSYVRKDGLPCSSGQTIIRFDDRFYGVAGGTVHRASAPLDADRGYRSAVLRCRA